MWVDIVPFAAAAQFINIRRPFARVLQRELSPHFRVDVIVLRRDPAAVLKSRVELGHFCGRQKLSDWLLLPDRSWLTNVHDGPECSKLSCSCEECEDGDGGDGRALQAVEMDGFEALIAYAAETEATIR